MKDAAVFDPVRWGRLKKIVDEARVEWRETAKTCRDATRNLTAAEQALINYEDQFEDDR